MQYKFWGFLFSLFLMGCSSVQNSSLEPAMVRPLSEKKTVQIADQTFYVEVARSDRDRMRGLMYRDFLEKGTGMLFVFEGDQMHPFWMKNTLIPLDIAWISSEGKVVDVQQMEPCVADPCPSYMPAGPSQYVLEVPLGELQAQKGDFFEILEDENSDF